MTGGGDLATLTESSLWKQMTHALVAVVVFTVPLFSANVVAGRGTLVVAVSVTPILLLSVLTYPRLPGLLVRNPRNPAGWLLLLIPVLMTVAALFNPSAIGWSTVFLAAVSSGLGLAIWDLNRHDLKRYVAIPLLTATAIQAALATAQLLTGEAVVPTLVAHDIVVSVYDGVPRPQGTMVHVYRLAALGLTSLGVGAIAQRRHARASPTILAALAAASALVAMTFSRAALIGVGTFVVVLGVAFYRGRRDAGVVAGVVAVAFVVTVLLTLPSWIARADHTAARSLDDASLGRMTLTAQAVDLAQLEPMTGVGPGQYLNTLEERGMLDERYPFIVHNYSLAFAVENGIPAGIAILGLLMWLGVVSFRVGPAATAAFGAILPLLMFDVLHYDSPSGQVMLGVWLGSLAAVIHWGPSARSTRIHGEKSPPTSDRKTKKSGRSWSD